MHPMRKAAWHAIWQQPPSMNLICVLEIRRQVKSTKTAPQGPERPRDAVCRIMLDQL
jgi:hypothetical protein